MKLFLLVLATAYIASATPVPEDEGPPMKEYPRFIEFPDHEGNLHTVDLEAEPEMDIIKDYERNPNNNVYLLFTRRNRILSQTLTMNNANSIRNSNFNPNVPTKWIAHGWLSSRYTEPNPALRAAFLDKSDVNVIVICWRSLAASLYNTAAAGVPAVGRGAGQMANFVAQTTGANLNSFHLIGFSLGAHLVGNMGRELGGRAARITGLDPAGPLWTAGSNRLRPTDGVYVEAIHTDGGTTGLGIGSNVANADFYPNGGNSQPGCLLSLCNHERAWELFASTVTNNHLVGRQCTTSLQITWNTCTGSSFPMGNDILTKFGTGMYRLTTGSRHPF